MLIQCIPDIKDILDVFRALVRIAFFGFAVATFEADTTGTLGHPNLDFDVTGLALEAGGL